MGCAACLVCVLAQMSQRRQALTLRARHGCATAGRPIQVTKDGETLNVVLLDSEGMGRPGAEAEHDARVFSLATLLSSLLVYNWYAPTRPHHLPST